MSDITRVLSIAAALVIALAPTAAAGPPAAGQTHGALRVQLRPAVVNLLGQSTITVSGIDRGSLQVRLAGAALPWQPLRSVRGAWVGALPTPSLRGVYPIVLRTGAGGSAIRPRGAFLRVVDRGALARPSFDEPSDVARWWVQSVAGGTLVALKAWPRPAFDRRDAQLHRLFVVAYSPPGQPEVNARLGTFVTAFRDGYNARWRLLEATLEP